MEHVTLGWGRDFADSRPVRGVMADGDEHFLSVAVDVPTPGPSMLRR